MSAPADSVLTLRDLEGWHFAGTALAVLGHPIGHSLSPRMHNAALAALARKDSQYATWRYFRFDIDPADLGRALPLFHARGFHGLNLTVPHKVIALPLLRKSDDSVKQMGAANTLVRHASGWDGFNTDGYGLTSAVDESLNLRVQNRQVVIVGAGGAGRGAAVECVRRGCSSLFLTNRSEDNLRALVSLVDAMVVRPGAFDLHAWLRGSAIPGELQPDSIIINATSAGLKVDDPLPIDLHRLPRPAAVFDMIYNPPETPLLQQARSLGIPAANGLAMLVHQGAKALEHWTGIPAARHAPVMAAALQP